MAPSDVVGTDHAPHPVEDKDCEWQAGAFGMTGLETALSVLIETMVATGRMTWRDIARTMSSTPARIGRLSDQGCELEVGLRPTSRWSTPRCAAPSTPPPSGPAPPTPPTRGWSCRDRSWPPSSTAVPPC